MDTDIAFDAVVFDLDGTLAATDRFWPEAARAGARRAFDELGIERDLPTHAEWMSMVGLSLDQGFEQVFADLGPREREVVQTACVEEENRVLARGAADFLPGVPETLAALRARGKQLGIASNCGRGYLRAMLDGLGLGQWVTEARCLDSPGIRDKADMVADLLQTFGTRSAVMVGDRMGDRDAAWANGLPHIHLARGYAPTGETFACEATIEGMDALVATLGKRARALADIAHQVDANASLRTLAVTGGPAAGKSLFVRDLLPHFAQRRCVMLDLHDWALPDATPDAANPQVVVAQSFALDELVRELLLPHSRGQAAAARGTEVAPGDLLILEGTYLLHPRVYAYIDRTLYLDAPDEVLERRVGGRDARLAGPQPLRDLRERTLPAFRAFERDFPATRADLIVEHANPLEPVLAASRDAD